MLFNVAGIIWKKMPKGMRRWLTRRFQATFTVSAAGIIINDKGEVLLLDHVLRPVSGWGLPGGFMDTGEQPEAALQRELREETGIELTGVNLAQVRTLHRHIEIIFTARGIGEPDVKSREITDFGWFDIDNMPAEMSQDQQSLILKALRSDDLKKESG
ncbi:MAG: NUDIX hydrolase [Chloracidobacterium sp.]|nr:NUDIX hydrolase [Chloracidobacterium sp.]